MKRSDYISWDEYFMGVASLSAQRSKDPSTQVGACIVNEENRIMTVGYNGMPRGCSDDEFPWEREGGMLDTKYAFVCHAEMNAILNCGTADLRNTRVYVTLFASRRASRKASSSATSIMIPKMPSQHVRCSMQQGLSISRMSLRAEI